MASRIDFERQRRIAHDEILTSALVEAAGSLVDDLLSALLAASATGFTIVKYAGAAYLIYLGVRQWRSRINVFDRMAMPTVAKGQTPLQLFLQGLLVATTNPKSILFFTALFTASALQRYEDRLKAWRDRLLRTHLLPAFQMSEPQMDRYLEHIARRRPRMLFGYASALAWVLFLIVLMNWILD